MKPTPRTRLLYGVIAVLTTCLLVTAVMYKIRAIESRRTRDALTVLLNQQQAEIRQLRTELAGRPVIPYRRPHRDILETNYGPVRITDQRVYAVSNWEYYTSLTTDHPLQRPLGFRSGFVTCGPEYLGPMESSSSHD